MDLPRTPKSTSGSTKPRSRFPVVPCLLITGGIGILICLAVIVVYVIRQAPNIALVQTTAPAGRIVFVSNRDGNAEIYVMDADGSNQTRLTNNFEQMDDNLPAWSADGSKIAFVSNRDGYQPEIYVMNADGSNQTRLTNDQAGDYYPVWSPDGQKIAFVSDRDGKYKTCVMNADGSYQTCLSNSELGNISPSLGMYGVDTANMGVSWSPDGQKIIYSSRRSGNAKIYVMNNDGGSQASLTNDWGDIDPDWSPDGQEIVFVSEREGHPVIYTMKADGSAQTRLANTIEGGSSSPAWSADGRHITFQSNQAGNYEIYVMAADGSNLTRLTDNQAEDWNPDWAPVALQDLTGTLEALPTNDTSSGSIGEMVEIPAGIFQMGCDTNRSGDTDCSGYDQKLHSVYLDTFQIDKFEVTNASYEQCVAAGVCTAPDKFSSTTRSAYYGNPNYANFPVIHVGWDQASEYCGWANKRLPTEAEWEKAARGSTDTRIYPWGDGNPDCTLANFGGPEGCVGDTSAVGSYPFGISPYGTFDMAGNVWEWVADWWMNGYFDLSGTHNPLGPVTGDYRVYRGGDWQTNLNSSYSFMDRTPPNLGVSYRISLSDTFLITDTTDIADYYDMDMYNVGFRCAASNDRESDSTPTGTPIALTTSTPFNDIPAPQPGKANLIGRVIWNNQPVIGTEVKLSCPAAWCEKPPFLTTTDAQGWYVFTNLPVGNYSVKAHSNDTDSDRWFSFYYPSDDDPSYSYYPTRPIQYDLTAGMTLQLEDLIIYKSDLRETFPSEGEQVNQKNPTLSWEPYPGAAYYGFYFGQEYLPAIGEKVVGNTYPISLSLPNCNYVWKVEAFNPEGIKISEFKDYRMRFIIVNQQTSCE
jgi:Tol biopolymer transport system component